MTTVPLAAEIVTTGTEILLGEIVDTNAAWIAQQLREAGVNLYYKTTVGDNEARVRGVLQLGMNRSNVILVTGGLGPTADDITRQAIANATNCPLILHEGALATLLERFARFGVTMTDNNRQQALIPDGAILIENPVGTAPGFIVETDTCAVIAMPGVPREMKRMMEESVLPYLRNRNGHTGIIRRRVLRTIGIGESTIDSLITDLMHAANPTVGLAAHTAQADIRITARAESAIEAESMIDAVEADIRQRLGQHVYSTTSGESIEAVVARLLQEQGATVALVETNTQGHVARRLSTALESMNPVIGSWVAAPSPPFLPAEVVATLEREAQTQTFTEATAALCARLAREKSGATYALALLGTHGADEGVYGQRSGTTWFALSTAHESTANNLGFGGQDEYTITRLGNQVLTILWRRLLAAHL